MIATAYWMAGSVLASNAARSALHHFRRASRLPSSVPDSLLTIALTALASLPPSHLFSTSLLRCAAGRATYWSSQ
ncbi:hypothetical protein G6F46_015603 [Rhizopus delemar]|nr:hypothetical protein G6F46_015603 [Rhizopus delemar]